MSPSDRLEQLPDQLAAAGVTFSGGRAPMLFAAWLLRQPEDTVVDADLLRRFVLTDRPELLEDVRFWPVPNGLPVRR